MREEKGGGGGGGGGERIDRVGRVKCGLLNLIKS